MQKAPHFALPDDPAKPIIMIGPGTGIAPFRAFLHERQAINAPGRNWLFFGHQRGGYDFFYEDELVAMRSSGLLTRLTLAWSRDSDQKIYVQHRMREVGRDFWSWLNDGAHIYVCGDALRMAKDVEARARRHHRRAWRLRTGRSGKVPRRAEDQGPLPDRRLLERAGCGSFAAARIGPLAEPPYNATAKLNRSGHGLPASAIESLRVFEAAARHNSFRKAADELNLTASAVSHGIQTLDNWLGVELFHRESRGLAAHRCRRDLCATGQSGAERARQGDRAAPGPRSDRDAVAQQRADLRKRFCCRVSRASSSNSLISASHHRDLASPGGPHARRFRYRDPFTSTKKPAPNWTLLVVETLCRSAARA